MSGHNLESSQFRRFFYTAQIRLCYRYYPEIDQPIGLFGQLKNEFSFCFYTFLSVDTSAGSGTRKPENPNFENETRQTRTRTFAKKPNPTKPEPEVQTRGYPTGSKWQKNDLFCLKITNFYLKILTYKSTFWYNFIFYCFLASKIKSFSLKLVSFCKIWNPNPINPRTRTLEVKPDKPEPELC